MDRPNKRKADVLENAEDADTGASSSLPAYTATNSGGSTSFPTKSDAGGSMSLTTSLGKSYDVFLSFRGPDTRNGFTDHLYHGLDDAGIDTFRDNNELSPGEEIGPELMAAIRNSKILIPVLSVTYGTSSWCLDELALMMELRNNNGRLVLPIFYKVEPAEVRYQTGDFGKAFKEREGRMRARPSFDPTKSKKWKDSLVEVCNLKGHDANGSEGELVKSIVRQVLTELKKEYEQDVPENLVGIGGHMENIMKFVDDNSSATLFIGIYGMGGIGKTTLAEYIYNKLSNQFKYCSFIADIRESCQPKNGLVHVQNQLIYDTLNQKDQVSRKEAGMKFISSKFKNKKVLILLDDVDHRDQLKFLVGNQDWFSSGSRVFITTRNYDIFKTVKMDHKYELEGMNEDDSMVLFCRNAFRTSSPPSEFKDLARDVITNTGGLPLSLEVLGSLLYEELPPFWEDTIDKLKEELPDEVRKVLKISYDALENNQKQIFLDIACLFIGTDRRIASYLWKDNRFFPNEGIEVLKLRSLIKCGDDHVLRMHDQLRDLGREIVHEENPEEPHCRSRLWDYKEARKVMTKNEGTNKIKAINLIEGGWKELEEEGKHDGDIYTGEQFKNLKHLKFLQMVGAHLSGDFNNSMEELRWLQWKGCPMDFEVTTFHVKELVTLELPDSKINEEWKGWIYFKMAKNLKFLDLSNCRHLENTDFLSAFKNLEVLILYFCCSLKQINSSIGDMKALRRLVLEYCQSLVKLPAEICKLKALEQLNLEYTQSLSSLPDDLGSLENLELLTISDCEIKKLPNSIKKLTKLRELKLSLKNSQKGTMLESIEFLENLEVLDLSDSGIEELPKGIGRLRKLRKLCAAHCENLKGETMESLCDLSSLQYLDFGFSKKLQSLPDLPSSLTFLRVSCQNLKLLPLSHLTHLKELDASYCKSLECIQVSPSALLKNSEFSQSTNVEESESPQSLHSPSILEILSIRNCEAIKTLDVSEFIHLRTLTLYCKNLPEVRGLHKLIYLEELQISCGLIERLDLSELNVLQKLEVNLCPSLVEIEGIDRLEFLEELSIYECTLIESLDLPKSTRLKRITAYCCINLIKIQGIDRLEFLEYLFIHECTLIKSLDLPKSTRLKSVKASHCENLIEIQGLDRLEFLEKLHIKHTLIESLDLPKSTRLKSVRASYCGNLIKIQGLDRLEFLEKLHIKHTLIEGIDLPKSTRLKCVKASHCENLIEIEGLDRLKFLEELYIERTLIERIDLPKSTSLKSVKVSHCENLIEIQGLDRLEFLEELHIKRTSIERIDLPKSRGLKELYVLSCKKLAEIQGLSWLEFLEKLHIDSCTLIEMLDLPKSERLKYLKAARCENLAGIQGLYRLEFLEELSIKGCTSIERLELPKLGFLVKLEAKGCEKLVEIQGLDTLDFLEILDISGCKSLKTIPKLPEVSIINETDESGSDYTDYEYHEYRSNHTDESGSDCSLVYYE